MTQTVISALVLVLLSGTGRTEPPPHYFVFGFQGAAEAPLTISDGTNVGYGGRARIGYELRKGPIGFSPELVFGGAKWTRNVSSTTPNTVTAADIAVGMRIDAQPWAAPWQPWLALHVGPGLEKIGGDACKMAPISDECEFFSGIAFDAQLGFAYVLTDNIAIGPFVGVGVLSQQLLCCKWFAAGLSVDFALFARAQDPRR